MPKLRSEIVHEAFEPLIQRGFSEPKASYEGTDLTFTLRRDADEFVLFSEDMGANWPIAFWRAADDTIAEIKDDTTYTAHSIVHDAPWPLSLYYRWRLRSELQAEVDRRVKNLATRAINYERLLLRARQRALRSE